MALGFEVPKEAPSMAYNLGKVLQVDGALQETPYLVEVFILEKNR